MTLLKYDVEDFSVTHPELYSQGWIPIGGVSIDQARLILVNQNGTAAALVDENLGAVFDNLLDFIFTISERAESCFTDETIIDNTYLEYRRVIDEAIGVR